jgi:hypothetical protein
MVQVPLFVFLFIYFIFLAVFVGFYLAIVYHIVISASFTLASFFVSFFIFAATALVLYTTLTLLEGVDWRQVALTVDLTYLKSFFNF